MFSLRHLRRFSGPLNFVSDKLPFPRFPRFPKFHRSYFEGPLEDKSGLSEHVDLEQHNLMLREYNLEALGLQRVLVVQPYFRRGELAVANTRREYMLQESLALVKTLGWEVADKMTVNVDAGQKLFFGTGQLDVIKNTVAKIEAAVDPDDDDEGGGVAGAFVSAVFISTYRLTPGQLLEIEEAVGKPVLDRYNIVLQIFKHHAVTREAKLQVKMAEIPYLKTRLDGEHALEQLRKYSKQRKGEEFFVKRQKMLAKRDRKIRQEIDELKKHRQLLRRNRFRLEIPSVAVVGYTNAGKTSLIKALTGEDRLRPKNQLFATLDVTCHGCRLPSGLKTVFLDTVGFISDIPTELITCFNSTLEDAALADVLVHVRDMSNEDHVSQDENVMETLRRINVPEKLMDNMIVVGNKIDLLNPEDWRYIKEDGVIPISCKEGYGMNYLLKKINESVIRATGRKLVTFRVGNDSLAEVEWLRANVTVVSVVVDKENDRYWNVVVLVNDADLCRFRKFFLGSKTFKQIQNR